MSITPLDPLKAEMQTSAERSAMVMLTTTELNGTLASCPMAQPAMGAPDHALARA